VLPKYKVKDLKINVISVLASTEDKNDRKISFYNILDRVYQTLPKHDAVILMGDMNAKVGEDFLTHYTGKYRLYKISNYNIEKLCDFATCRVFVTVSAVFPLKNILLITQNLRVSNNNEITLKIT